MFARLLAVLALLSGGTANAVPLQTIGTFCGLFPDQCRKGTESLLAARGIGTDAYYVMEIDPATGALPVSVSGTIVTSNASVGPTGSAVPASATFAGFNNGGTLIGGIADSSGRQIVAGAGTAGTPAGGVLTVQGVTSMTPIASSQSGTWTVQPGNTANTTPWLATISQGGNSATVSAGGALKVDGSASTQPVSGTVAVTQSTSPWVVSGSTTSSGGAYADSVRNVYSSTNVTTGAWVQLIASTAAVINCMTIFDSSGQTLELGTGAAASETRVLIVTPGGISGCVPLHINASTRLSIRAISATASSGEIDITGIQ